MTITKRLGMILLSIWLIVGGLVQVFSISVPSLGIVLAILAIAAGVLLLFDR